MGYNVDEAVLAIEEDKKTRGEEANSEKPKGNTKAVRTTKEEQDALLAKIQAI